MGGKLNKQAYKQIIEDDIQELHKLPKTLERDHIEVVLNYSIKFLYDFERAKPLPGMWMPNG